MAIVEIKEAEPWHARAIIDNLRDQDQHIFEKARDPEAQIIREIKRASFAFTGFVHGEVACIWGANAGSIIVDEFYVWLLTTKLVEEHGFLFVRNSQLIMKHLLKQRSIVRGHVLVSNERSIRWLKWLGCKLEMVDNEPRILEFVLRRA